MPVDTRHPDAIAMSPTWELIRDTIAGERAIKLAGKKYLPALPQQTPEQYAAYQFRALWLGATENTKLAFSGMICRKPPTTTALDSVKAFLDNCDGQGTPFTTFTAAIVDEMVTLGWGGTLIDWTTSSRPYFVNYWAEQIWNWKFRSIDGIPRLSMLMLREESSEYSPLTGGPPPDPYTHPVYEQFREYELMGESPEELRVIVRIKRAKTPTPATANQVKSATPNATGQGREFVTLKEEELTIRGLPVREIPFVPHNCTTNPPFLIPKPFLADIASINIKHYAQTADLENGRHITGVPTPYIGAEGIPEDTKFPIGANEAWVFASHEVKVGYLEFSGAGLGELRQGVEEKQKQMAALGARALTPEKASAEAYQTLELRARGESAQLVTLAEVVSKSLSICLSWAAYIISGNASSKREEFEKTNHCVLNKDLTSTAITSEMLTSFTAALQAGAISVDTFFYNLKAREVYPDGWTREQEQTAIEANPPAPPQPPAV